MSEEKPDEKPAADNSMVIKAVAAVFAMVIAPVLVTFGVKYSDVIIGNLTNKPEAAKSELEKSEPAKSDSAKNEPVKAEASGREPAQADSARTPPIAAQTRPAADSATTAGTKADERQDAGGTSAGASGRSATAAGGRGDGPRGRLGLKKNRGAAAATAGPVVRLFNLQDLSGWYTYVDRTSTSKGPPGRNIDPDGVFKVVSGTIRISGQYWGTLTTEKEYDSYHLTLEFKWGAKTWGEREKAARQSGVLLHCIGSDGAHLGWAPQSVKCQIIEGGTGDFVCLNTVKDKTVTLSVEAAAPDAGDKKRNRNAFIYQPGEPLTTVTQGFVRRLGNGNDWKNVVGYHRPGDIENPTGEWNTLECICQGNRIQIVLNGKVVNEAVNVKPSRGKISLQSQGAEIFFRKVELQSLAGK